MTQIHAPNLHHLLLFNTPLRLLYPSSTPLQTGPAHVPSDRINLLAASELFMKFPIIFVPPFARTRTWTFLPSNVIARLRMVARETREEVQQHCIFIFRFARESLECSRMENSWRLLDEFLLSYLAEPVESAARRPHRLRHMSMRTVRDSSRIQSVRSLPWYTCGGGPADGDRL